ncbi:mannose-1-phosphate guanylyltransferase [Adhaeretor mobilis]|uniref:mannose-1-phosphate guanylyltransferase n=1 Tax=Adhaeretor mobilis TaxID=1930276 RepID=A0A517N221_9BACT|nr:mannose-1-phosphate guanylyltransferase [Adhaeretor mobilis]QDT01173.1 Mannose-1-phosphate guanylyltransferase [Adhaeretor mobilis]
MLHAIIMAGGTGTRFWPASTATRPKQLLNLVGNESMIRQTVDRLGTLIPAEQTLIVTNRRLLLSIQEQLPELPAASLVGEPCKRDTAPCIGLAALLVSKNDPDATMAVMPADHVIRSTDRFQSALKQAARLVEDAPDRIVTFGIRPTYPAEIFGYIQRGSRIETHDGEAPTFVVKQFREKPDAATATQYVAEGDYYWNSGIFIWKAKTILDALAKRQPEMLEHLEKIGAAWGTDQQGAVLEKEFTAIKGISIDYAVMEHAKNVAVIEAPYDWDDLGGWKSLERLVGEDRDGNTIVGKHLGLNTKGTIVRGEGDHLIVTLGLKNCLIVHTENATLVANKDDEESIREVVKELEKRGWKEYL